MSSANSHDRFLVAISETGAAQPLQSALSSIGVNSSTFGSDAQTSCSLPLERWIIELSEGKFDYILFTSAQGVHLVAEMASQLDKRDELMKGLSQAHKMAAGKRPSQALSGLGAAPDTTIKDSDKAAVIQALRDAKLAGKTVGVQPLDPNMESAVADCLQEWGALPRMVAPTTTVDPEATQLLSDIADRKVRALFFLTAHTTSWLLDACRAAAQEDRLIKHLRNIPVLATEEAAGLLRRRGVHPDVIFHEDTLENPDLGEIKRTLGLGGDETGLSASTVGKHRVVVVGNGMVGYKVCERLTAGSGAFSVHVTALGEEDLPAYDRVHLSEYFSGKSAQDLLLEPSEWYRERRIDLRLNQKVVRIDRESRVVVTEGGQVVPYDSLVLATGAMPFVPPIPGVDLAGVFVYRTVKDLERITRFAKKAQSAAVIGGGLLGLEAAKAAQDLGLRTHVLEQAPRLMPRQLDDAGAALLRKEIESIGVQVHTGRRTTGLYGDRSVSGVQFADGEMLSVDMIIVSAGIKPRDAVAKEAGLALGERGGVRVDDMLRTSDPNIFAIGECAIHEGTLYGLVSPGYEMASAVAKTIHGQPTKFAGADMSTKLKLLGVDVASIGDPFADEQKGSASIVYQDLINGIYKKLIVDDQGKKLLGAILVGDCREYAALLPYAKSGDELPMSADEMLFGSRGRDGVAPLPIPDTAQICSCNNVTKLDIIRAIDADPGCGLDTLKKCTKAGTGCGGCLPLVTDLFQAEMTSRGQVVKKNICEHFDYSRQELYDIARVGGFKTFLELLEKHGRGHGCEVCKPAVASILATTGTDPILDHQMLQDTNDRFLANIQRRGLYSVVPRIPGGEITPEKLIAIGQVAKKYNLYTKVTGGQRIDLFGARIDQLPDIWEELIAAGFESGHAYAKALRTVKSCVGSTWCRYGVQDSVGFAIRVENRYKGLRSPHKLKSAVSGCTRECAEAQGKDFGLIATEHGYNLYVGGNGGTKPRHAELLAADIDEETAIKYIDRFLMYYIRTADKLQRTSVWLDKIEGGIEHVRNVVVKDSLGLGEQLEADIQKLINGYVCEWKDALDSPKKRALFRHFAGQDKASRPVEMVTQRRQSYPAPWPTESLKTKVHLPVLKRSWVKLVPISDVPEEGGTAISYGASQLAVFHFKSKNQWFLSQNMCPHKREMVLARGLVGDVSGTPKVACPFHKKTFNLETGAGISDEDLTIATFTVKVEAGWVYGELPSEKELEEIFRKSGCVEDCAVAAE